MILLKYICANPPSQLLLRKITKKNYYRKNSNRRFEFFKSFTSALIE